MSARPSEADRATTCRGCGTGFTSAAWGKLELSTRAAPGEIRALAVGWPDDVCVEVRVCSRCQRRIAVKRSMT